jgi:hypothetical protein
MLRHISLARTNVSEEYIVSIIRVARIGELRAKLEVTSIPLQCASVASYC